MRFAPRIDETAKLEAQPTHPKRGYTIGTGKYQYVEAVRDISPEEIELRYQRRLAELRRDRLRQ